MILGICDNPEILKVMMLIKIVISAICVAVPIILIVVLMLDYSKAVSSNDNDMVMKVTRNLPYRMIAVVVIFFIPSLVKIVVNIADGSANTYIGCIENATPDNIESAYTESAADSVRRAKETLSINDYYAAKTQISKVKDVTEKNELSQELEDIKVYIDLKTEIDRLTTSYNRKDYNALYDKINAIEDEEMRNKLITFAEEIKGQKPLNIASGAFQKKFTGSKDYLDYWEFIPNNPTTNMPIVIFLHGDGEVSNINAVKNIGFIRGSKAIYGDDYPYIILQPNRRSQRWQVDTVMTTLKELIDETCDKYLCDTDHIIITGMSGGAVGVWNMVSKYGDYFSCAVPVSCPGYVKVESYKNVPVRAFVGGAADDYNTYHGSMYANVQSLKNAGLNATLEVIKGGTHGSTYHTVYSTPEVVEWMLEQ